jgi:hypothetical protein
MSDYRQYIQKPGEWNWIEREQKRLGSEAAFYKLRGQMLIALSEIPTDKFLNIDKVQEENKEMFVKIACEFMLMPAGEDYRFNKLVNKIYHELPVKKVPKIIISNEKTQ